MFLFCFFTQTSSDLFKAQCSSASEGGYFLLSLFQSTSSGRWHCVEDMWLWNSMRHSDPHDQQQRKCSMDGPRGIWRQVWVAFQVVEGLWIPALSVVFLTQKCSHVSSYCMTCRNRLRITSIQWSCPHHCKCFQLCCVTSHLNGSSVCSKQGGIKPWFISSSLTLLFYWWLSPKHSEKMNGVMLVALFPLGNDGVEIVSHSARILMYFYMMRHVLG